MGFAPLIQPMSETDFWSIVGEPQGLTEQEVCDRLRDQLVGLSNETILAFHLRQQLVGQGPYKNARLIAAHYVVFGCFHEFQFSEFVDWMIFRGKTFFNKVLKDPNILATDHADQWADAGYVAARILEEERGYDVVAAMEHDAVPLNIKPLDKLPDLTHASEMFPLLESVYWPNLQA